MPLSYSREKKVWRKHRVPEYALYDDFLNNYPAVFASPKLCEPGPGSWLVSDAGNNMSTNLGSLVYSGAMPGAWDVCMLANTLPFGRKAGRYVEFEFTPLVAAGYARIGWNFVHGTVGTGVSASIQNNEAVIYIGGGGFVLVTDGLDPVNPLYPYALGTSYVFRIQDTGTGFLYYARTTLGGPSSWKLIWERTRSTPHLSALTPGYNNHSQQGTSDYLRVREGWVKPPALQIARPGTAQLGNQGDPDCLIDALMLVPRNAQNSLYFRITSSVSYWRAQIDTLAFPSTYSLIKTVGGVDTVVSSVNVPWGVGNYAPLKVAMFGSHIRCFYGINAGPFGDNSFNQTAIICGKGPPTGAPSLPDGDMLNLRSQTGGTLLLD